MLFDFLYGINTVTSLFDVNAGHRKVYEIVISSGKIKSSQRINEIIRKAKTKSIPVLFLNHAGFLNYLKTNAEEHAIEAELKSSQGIIAKTSQYSYSDLDHSLRNELKGRRNSLLVILDEVTDVGNFGSILRNCSAFAADGIIISKNRCVGASARAGKISSGALEELKIYSVVNIVSTIEKLKREGFWIYGTTVPEKKGAVPADKISFTFPLAVIFGGEKKGIGNLVSKKCDFLITVETAGVMKSLNVSSASAVILYIIRHFEKEGLNN